eukprot:275667_1
MDTLSFVDPSTFNHTLIYREAGICATNNATHIFAVGSKCHNCSMAHSDIEIFEIDTNGPWIIAGNMNMGRYWSGCNVYRGHLYVFGGYLNHDMHTNQGDVSGSIEKCALHPNEIVCSNLSDTQLHIPRAQHQIVMNKDALMFIIGGVDSTTQMPEIVELFDASKDTMMTDEWFTYITNGRDGFATSYDAQWDVIYVIGGIDNTQTTHDTIEYFPVCELFDNCYSNEITLQCGDHIRERINHAHDLYSFYFEITDADHVLSMQFDNCDSSMDTYVFLFVWNATIHEWKEGYLPHWQWDDAGDCTGHKQESFVIEHPHNGYYHLVISGHGAGDYYADFTCTYADVNTTAPTLEPTLEPTTFPTTKMTVNPTVFPTEIPTEHPIDWIRSTADYDRISFVLSFVCETQLDLSTIDWKALVLDGLLNAFEADLRFLVDTKIDGGIYALQDRQDAMHKTQSNTKRVLLGASDTIYYFDIECNVSTDRMYLAETDVCAAGFAHAFADGFDGSMDQIQIYALAECDTDLLIKTWFVNDADALPIDALPIVILLIGLTLVLVMAIIVQCIRTYDNLKTKQLLLWAVYVTNAYCDVFIAFHLCVTWRLLWEGMISFVIVIIPWIKSIWFMNIFVAHWRCDTAHGELLKRWLDPYHRLLYALSFILGSSYAAMAMVNTNLFGIDVFSMGLSPDLHQIFRKQRFWVVLLRNIPQIILQTVLMAVHPSTYSVVALCASIGSIVAYVYNRCTAYPYNDGSAKCMVFSWRISSVSIARNASRFGNKCDALRQTVSKILEINDKQERLDLLNAIQYFDTDIGGLTVYILITSKIDKNMEYFMKELQRVMQNNTLSKQIQRIWGLPTNEDVHCYRLKGIEPTTRSTSQMEMSLRLHKHIKVHTTDAHEDASDSEDNGVGMSTSSPNDRAKHKRDFVVLNTTEDADGDEVENAQQHLHEQYEYGFSLNSTTHEDLL